MRTRCDTALLLIRLLWGNTKKCEWQSRRSFQSVQIFVGFQGLKSPFFIHSRVHPQNTFKIHSTSIWLPWNWAVFCLFSYFGSPKRRSPIHISAFIHKSYGRFCIFNLSNKQPRFNCRLSVLILCFIHY